jgi:hypothetical protein
MTSNCCCAYRVGRGRCSFFLPCTHGLFLLVLWAIIRLDVRGFFARAQDIAAVLAAEPALACGASFIPLPPGLENDAALLSLMHRFGGVVLNNDADTGLFPEAPHSPPASPARGHIRLLHGVSGPAVLAQPSAHRLDTYATSHAEAAKRAGERAPRLAAAQAAHPAAKVRLRV